MADSRAILVSAGGTGGGVYPALAVVEALHRIAPDRDVHFVGSLGGMESGLVSRDLVAGYHEISSGPLHGVGLRRASGSAFKIGLGVLQSLRLIGRLRPAALFLTGGWATFPVALACWLRRLPVAIFVPDIEPALAIKALSRISRLVMTVTPDSAAYFPRGVRILETGYPLRAALLSARREDAIRHFGLDLARKTLLVVGGSRGSRHINEALAGILPDLLADGLQVIHVSGELDWPAVQARHAALPEPAQALYHAYAYLHDDMGLALAAADLALSRAGASTLGEFPHFGLPAILAPLSFAWRYQKVNADWLVSRGAALRLDDEQLPARLLPTIRDLFGDPGRSEAMRRAASALDRSDAADRIAGAVLALAKNGGSG